MTSTTPGESIPSAVSLPAFTVAEPLGCHWQNEIVSFEAEALSALPPLTGEEPPSSRTPAYEFHDESGRVWPAQVELKEGTRPVLYTCIDLEPHETLQLTLVEAEECENPLAVVSAGRVLGIHNEHLDVRVPATQSFQAGPIPGPVVSGRMAGGEWIGQGGLIGARHVGRINTEILARGPVFARWRIRYAIGGKTAATFLCTLYRGADFVWLEEESSTDFDLFFEYVLEGDDAPDVLLSHGAGEHPQRTRRIGYTTNGKIFHIDSNSGWHQLSHSWCGLYRHEHPTMLGVLEMRGGSWRQVGRNRIEVHEDASRRVTARSPLRGGTKQWALMFSPVEKNLVDEQGDPRRSHLGSTHKKWSELPLSKVLNWHLDWRPPAPNGPLRLFGRQRLPEVGEFWAGHSEIARVFRNNAEGYLECDEGQLTAYQANSLMADLLLTGNVESARRAKIGMLRSLRTAFANARDGGYHQLIIFDGRSLKLDLQTFDLLDALGYISDNERGEICRITAFLAHCFQDRDYFPFELNMLERADEQSWAPALWDEMGDTLCPPNFMTEYITSFGMAACSFPDHPDAARWREDAIRLYSRQLERHYYDGGAYCESINYHHHNQTMTLQMALAFRENGHHDFFEHPRFRDQFPFWVDIMTPPVVRNEAGMGLHSPKNSPDAGAQGLRMIPNNGNTGTDCSDYHVPAELAMAAAVVRDRDPALSARLMRAWREGGRLCLNNYNVTSFLLVADPGLPEAPDLSLGSKLVNGLGATFRGQPGTPEEVYALVKCGWATHHNDQDDGGFCIWAYGAPVSGDQGYHYHELDGQVYGGNMTRLHNCITFDRKSPALAGQETAFPPECFRTTDLADLLVAHLPSDYLMDTPTRSYLELILCERIEHRRFFLFVKPHYFLVYDHLPQNVYTTQWYLHCQSKSVAIDGAAVQFEGNWGIDLCARLFLPEEPRIREGQFGVQKHVVVEQAGANDFFAWIAPVRSELKFKLKQRELPNVIRVTGPDYVDTVILSPTPLCYGGDGIRFQGRVGVVRHLEGRVETALLDGSSLEVD